MGDWMTLSITGTIDPADVAAARHFVETGDDYSRFHCLCYSGPSLCGIGRWIPPSGGVICAVGNAAERDYTAESVAEVLRDMVKIAPSLDLKVHCGGPYEADECVATVTAHEGMVTVGPPEIETVGAGMEAMTHNRAIELLTGGFGR